MAKKTKLEVATEFGTFTRTTDHPYQFVVISRGYLAATVERIHKHAIESAKDNLAYELDQLAGANGQSLYDWESRESVEASVERNRKMIADADEILAAQLAEAAAAKYGVQGWTSRIDLARKSAAKARENFKDVRIIEVATGKEVR